ncbi:hypothetical protein AX17_003389 [Amanita inopinata Kibby_2008]|nr:hypothetical protein AX17_003389 [Amanita inopinata Kibby_2008]
MHSALRNTVPWTKSLSPQCRRASTLSGGSKYRILVIGGGSGGLSVAHQIYDRFKAAGKSLNAGDIAIVDGAEYHYYQPGWTLVGSGLRAKSDFRRPLGSLIPKQFAFLSENVKTFSPTTSTVMTESGRALAYDMLVIATGMKIKWDAVKGLKQALATPTSGVSSIYSSDSCDKVWRDIENLQSGRAVFTQPAGVIKCAGAPQKIMWMARDRYARTGRLGKIKIDFYTGMPTMFSVKRYADALEVLRLERDVGGHFLHNLTSIDVANHKATFKVGDNSTIEVGYSLLHVTPPMGPLDVIAESPIADGAGWVEVNQETLQHIKHRNIFALGDCSSLPTSKTAAAITAQAPVLTENLFSVMDTGKVATAKYDGYTSCPLLTGYGELMLAEFKYGLIPKESFGSFFDQTKSQRFFYHLKKDLFPAVYWNLMVGERKVVWNVGADQAKVWVITWTDRDRSSMSRLTTAQVIGLGEYLEPDFDPASLTVSQLLGILGYHNVKYPTPYSKPKLIQIFNDEVKTRSTKFKKERLKKENSQASDEGIKDGLTGKPLTAVRTLPQRRASRRQSHAPVQDLEISPPRQESPKRRRSSAQPVLLGSSKGTAAIHPALIEESEHEDVPLKKVSKNKKSEAAGAESRRLSQSYAEDSGWEDNNIFQSGAEDSSPARPSPAKAKGGRRSVTVRKSRKSASAPPQITPPLSPSKRLDDTATVKVPQSKFEPDLPLLMTPEAQRSIRSSMTPGLSPGLHEVSFMHERDNMEEFHERPIHYGESPRKLDVVEELTEESSSQEKEKSASMLQKPIASRKDTGSHLPSSIMLRLLSLAFLVATIFAVLNYKMESASIGYCERGTDTNNYLDATRARRSAIESCNRENRTHLDPPMSNVSASNSGDTDGGDNRVETCPLMPLLPIPQPNRCTPCPGHATCDRHSITCDTGYLLRPHVLVSFLPALPSPSNTSLSSSLSPLEMTWKLISMCLDGLPGIGSIALPPRCTEDPKRKRNIGALGKAIEALVGQERGSRLCVGGRILREVIGDEDGGDAKKWGVELRQLREAMRKKTSAHLLAAFDDTFNEAVQQLVQWGGVIVGEDQRGNRYLAHKTPNLTWTCTAIVKAREAWEKWYRTVIGIVVTILLVLMARARRIQQQAENKRVAELVQIALNSLRNQELAHHTDPITAPHSFLSSLQLRDLVLQDEHSIPLRKRLWDRVEHVVEENANVRVNLEEVQGGDEMRVWRWVGGTGRTEAG